MGLDRAINAFAEAAMLPGRWPAALENLAENLGADGATLTRGVTTRNDIAVSRSLRDVVDEYFATAIASDPREPRVHPTTERGFHGDFDDFTAAEISADPFYTEFLRPRGMGWHATAALSDGPEPLMLNLKRRFSRGAYQPGDLAEISRALPHLRASAHLVRLSLDARAEDFLAQENAERRAAILLDVQGRVVEWNAHVAFDKGLAVRNGRLVTAIAEDQAKLDLEIAVALAVGRPSELPVPRPVAVRNAANRYALVVRVSRFQHGGANPVSNVRATVSIRDLGEPIAPQASLLRDMFALTPRETEVAILLGKGLSADQIAKRSGITLAHARQRVKSVLQKTETRRQGELLALFSRLH